MGELPLGTINTFTAHTLYAASHASRNTRTASPLLVRNNPPVYKRAGRKAALDTPHQRQPSLDVICDKLYLSICDLRRMRSGPVGDLRRIGCRTSGRGSRFDVIQPVGRTGCRRSLQLSLYFKLSHQKKGGKCLCGNSRSLQVDCTTPPTTSLLRAHPSR